MHVSRRRFRDAGRGEPDLVCACAERLPFEDGVFDAVVALGILEFVRDAGAVLAECARVLRPGGRAYLTSANRYAPGPEPHVGLWGVGWLPQRLQRAYVHWRSGKPYEFTVLMSSVGLAKKLRRSTQFKFRILIPKIADADIAHFPPAKGKVARLFNRISQTALLRPIFLSIGPFFRVTGAKIAASVMSLVVLLDQALSGDLESISALVLTGSPYGSA